MRPSGHVRRHRPGEGGRGQQKLAPDVRRPSLWGFAVYVGRQSLPRPEPARDNTNHDSKASNVMYKMLDGHSKHQCNMINATDIRASHMCEHKMPVGGNSTANVGTCLTTDVGAHSTATIQRQQRQNSYFAKFHMRHRPPRPICKQKI